MSRRMIWAVASAGVAALLAGGAVSQGIDPASSSQSLSPQTESAVPFRAAAALPTAAESSGSPLSAVAADEVRVLAGGPVMDLTCPGAGADPAPQFVNRITATTPYTVTIDYGDGVRYSNDDRHLNDIFAHNYLQPGTFTVDAVLTDATGQTTTATCVYSWTPQPLRRSGGTIPRHG